MTKIADGLTMLGGEFSIYLSSREIEIDRKVDAKVTDLWEKARLANPGLFDGNALVVEPIFDQAKLKASLIPYRYCYAQLQDPLLKQELDLTLLAVSGLTIFSGKILVGKRSAAMTQFPLHYELAPSGGLTANQIEDGGLVDYREGYYEELFEEAGISRSEVESLHVLAIFFDRRNQTLDICLEGTIKKTFVQNPNWPISNDEYDWLDWVEPAEVSRMVSGSSEIVPLSAELLRNWFERH